MLGPARCAKIPGMEVVNRNRVTPFVTKDTSVIREILAPRNSSLTRQSLAEATLGPGQSTEAHLHPRAEEIYYVLAGRGEMAVAGEVRAVEAGDAVALPRGVPHQIRNTGERDLVFLCCCAPPYEHDDTELVPPLLPPEARRE